MSDLLPIDMPMAPRTTARASLRGPTVCCTCGSSDWTRCRPGTASTAELYPASNIVALRADGGESTVAWCMACDPLVVRGAPAVDRTPGASGEAEYRSWSLADA
jgi:hypothetical protein